MRNFNSLVKVAVISKKKKGGKGCSEKKETVIKTSKRILKLLTSSGESFNNRFVFAFPAHYAFKTMPEVATLTRRKKNYGQKCIKCVRV